LDHIRKSVKKEQNFTTNPITKEQRKSTKYNHIETQTEAVSFFPLFLRFCLVSQLVTILRSSL